MAMTGTRTERALKTNRNGMLASWSKSGARPPQNPAAQTNILSVRFTIPNEYAAIEDMIPAITAPCLCVLKLAIGVCTLMRGVVSDVLWQDVLFVRECRWRFLVPWHRHSRTWVPHSRL